MASGRFGRCMIPPRQGAEIYHNQSGNPASLTINAQVIGTAFNSEITTVVGVGSTTLGEVTYVGLGSTAGYLRRFAGPVVECKPGQYNTCNGIGNGYNLSAGLAGTITADRCKYFCYRDIANGDTTYLQNCTDHKDSGPGISSVVGVFIANSCCPQYHTTYPFPQCSQCVGINSVWMCVNSCRFADSKALNFGNLGFATSETDGWITSPSWGNNCCCWWCLRVVSCIPKGAQYGGNELINPALGLCRRCYPPRIIDSYTHVCLSTACCVNRTLNTVATRSAVVGWMPGKPTNCCFGSEAYQINGCNATNAIQAAQLFINPCCNCFNDPNCLCPAYPWSGCPVGMSTQALGFYTPLCGCTDCAGIICRACPLAFSMCCHCDRPCCTGLCSGSPVTMLDWYSMDPTCYNPGGCTTCYQCCDGRNKYHSQIITFTNPGCSCGYLYSGFFYSTCCQIATNKGICYNCCLCIGKVDCWWPRLPLLSCWCKSSGWHCKPLTRDNNVISPYGFKNGMTHCAFMYLYTYVENRCECASAPCYCDESLWAACCCTQNLCASTPLTNFGPIVDQLTIQEVDRPVGVGFSYFRKVAGDSCYLFGYPDVLTLSKCRHGSCGYDQSLLALAIQNPPTSYQGCTAYCYVAELPVKYLSYNPNILCNECGQEGCVYMMARSSCKEECGIFSFNADLAYSAQLPNNFCCGVSPGIGVTFQCVVCCVRLSNNDCNPALNNTIGPFACCGFWKKVADFPVEMTCPELFHPTLNIMCTSCIVRADICHWTMSVWDHCRYEWRPFYTQDLVYWKPTETPYTWESNYFGIANGNDPCRGEITCTHYISYGSTADGTVDCFVTCTNCFICNMDRTGVLDYKINANTLERTGVVISNDDRIMVNNNSDHCLSVQAWGFEA